MLIINGKQIERIAAEREDHPLHSYALEYKRGVEKLKKEFGKEIKFKRPKYPKRTKGLDSRNREVPNLALPVQPLIMPLTARLNTDTGLEIWEYCEGPAKLLPNGLWEATGKRSRFIYEGLVLNLEIDSELAFFIYYKSPLFSREGKGGKVRIKQLIVNDPTAAARKKGEAKRAELELNTAIYGILQDEERLKLVAQAWGVSGTATKHPDAIRDELETKVKAGDALKKKDPAARGISEFLEEMKVTDSVRLRSILTVAKEKEMLKCTANGEWKCGERLICKVPLLEMKNKDQYLSNHLHNSGNREKLQDLLRDIVNKEYLDAVTDSKAIFYLARMMGLKVEFKSKEEIRDSVYECFLGKID